MANRPCERGAVVGGGYAIMRALYGAVNFRDRASNIGSRSRGRDLQVNRDMGRHRSGRFGAKAGGVTRGRGRIIGGKPIQHGGQQGGIIGSFTLCFASLMVYGPRSRVAAHGTNIWGDEPTLVTEIHRVSGGVPLFSPLVLDTTVSMLNFRDRGICRGTVTGRRGRGI